MSTNPLPAAKPDHRTLPRKKRAPSSRDQAILVAYRVQGRTQADLAEDNRLSQRRISEIVRRVERWRADLIPAAENELDRGQRERFERWLERERLQAIHTSAMRAHDAQVTELKTVREGQRDGKPFKDETRRQQQPSVQFLKLALRATTDIGRLNDKPPVDKHEPKDAHSRWWQTHALLCEIRRAARAAGQLGPADGQESAIVQEWMKALAGEGEVQEEVESPKSKVQSQEGEEEVQSPRSKVQGQEEADSTLDLGLGTLDSCDGNVFNSSNRSNPAAAELAETAVVGEPNVPRERASSPSPGTTSVREVGTSDLGPGPSDLAPPSPQKKKTAEQLPLSPAERRLLHQQKLEQYREAQRSGLPTQFVFDPADGPVPRPPVQIDDYGYVPSPPPSREQRIRENEEYLAHLRAQQEANDRRWQAASQP